MDGCACRKRMLRHLLRRLALADDAREVLLRRARSVVPPRATDDEPGQLELCLERIALRDAVLLHDEPVPLVEQRVGDAHRFAELLLRRFLEPDVVAARRAHPGAVPAV